MQPTRKGWTSTPGRRADLRNVLERVGMDRGAGHPRDHRRRLCGPGVLTRYFQGYFRLTSSPRSPTSSSGASRDPTSFMTVDRDGILRLPEQFLEVSPRRRRGWTRIGQLPASPGSSAGRSGDAATMRGACRDPAEPYDAVGLSGSWPSHLESQRVVQRAISKSVSSGVGQADRPELGSMCVS